MSKLTSRRKKIDGIDKQLIVLLNKRASLAKGVGRLKSRAGKGVYVPDREAEIYKNIMEKKRKGNFNMGGLRVQFLFHFFKNRTETLDIYLPMEPVQNLNKPAHVCTLKMMGQVYIHVYGGNRLLTFLGFVQDCYRVGNCFDTNLLSYSKTQAHRRSEPVAIYGSFPCL